MVWKRARKPEQKEQRRAALLAAAAQLFEEQGIDKVSLNALARAANISKANIYRYFESREEIFLHLLLEDYREYVDALGEALAPLAGSDDEAAVAREIVSTIVARPRFAALIAVLTSVLERNVTVETVVWFKTEVLGIGFRLIPAVKGTLPALEPEQIFRLLGYVHFLIAGMWPAAHPPPAVAEALKRPELAVACVDFERDLGEAIATTLRGMKAKA